MELDAKVPSYEEEEEDQNLENLLNYQGVLKKKGDYLGWDVIFFGILTKVIDSLSTYRTNGCKSKIPNCLFIIQEIKKNFRCALISI